MWRQAFFTITLVLAFSAVVFPQEPDRPGPLKQEQPDPPKNMREMLKKMQIAQAKKDYQEMIDRGEEALKLSEELNKEFLENSTLSRTELDKLENLEKLVKKIRGELGGGDGDDSSDDDNTDDPSPNNLADGFKSLPSLTGKLVDELKKTTRFGISAVAIQSSNAVLKVVRFLRLRK
jgi:hypothetical protein